MFEQHSHLASYAGRWGVGPGIASYTAWIVAFALVLLIAWLGWWTMRPAKRAARSKRTEVARAKQTRKTR